MDEWVDPDLSGIDGGVVNRLSRRDAYLARLEHMMDGEPELASDDATPDLDGPIRFVQKKLRRLLVHFDGVLLSNRW
jgi:hypothetical protein